MHRNSEIVKRRLLESGFPLMPSVSHIVPLLVADTKLCSQASKMLLDDYDIYIQVGAGRGRSETKEGTIGKTEQKEGGGGGGEKTKKKKEKKEKKKIKKRGKKKEKNKERKTQTNKPK